MRTEGRYRWGKDIFMGNLKDGEMGSSLAAMFDRALQHHQEGRVVEAEQAYREILAIDADHADSLHLLGMIAYQAGDCDTAIERIRRAIEIHPRASSYYSNLGNILQHLGRAREAGSCYLQALAIKPDLVEARVNLANVFLSAGDIDHAIEWYGLAIALKPDLPEAHKNLGDAYRVQEQLDLAIAAYERAVTLRPGYADALNELGGLLRNKRDLEGAVARYREALTAEPEHPRAGFAEALALLLQGELRDGWAAYERRWSSTDHATPMRAYPQPAWRGESIDGSLLLWPEQGIGDEIMFSGSVPDVVRTGTHCILECDARLQPLFARSFPEVEVISDREAGFDPARKVVAQLPIGSLPGLYRNDWSEFAASRSPYLRADPATRERYRSRYAHGGRVAGLAWYSNNVKNGAERSIALPVFKPLFEVANLRWISLQYGEAETLGAEVAAAGVPVFVDPEVDQLQDIDGFAAQVAAMDLVVTIDNTTAHLAGALGVPVWLLLPFAPDWRWVSMGDRSPWYPAMRIFQQPERGDWESVVVEVREALLAL
jgi:tetratricopeptide (TPR) repeat protein